MKARVFAAVAALLLAPWLFRAIALLESTQGSKPSDLRGFAADASVALVLLALLWLLAMRARWISALVVGVLAVGYHANYETITALGSVASPLDLKFLADPTFLRGSALAMAHPVIFGLVVTTSVALGWIGLRGAALGDVLVALASAGVLFGALSVWPSDPGRASWRQVNALRYNVEWLAFRDTGEDLGTFASPANAMRDLVPGISADLDAPPRFDFNGRGRNVLLIVLEGVSGGYLPTAADRHKRRPFYPLARLDRTFSENVGYATFFTHQRRTNRGLFAILCGEYPRLVAGLPKMSVTAGAPWRRCLPELLQDHGYRTVYLQSAPLAFMQKDRFMPAIGFDETIGHTWFEDPYLRTFWGVDDRTLFEQVLGKIDELEEGEEPWFLTMLNVGTHHPYTVPSSFETPYNDEFRRAFNYMDQYFQRFLRELERRGLRDDTLILLTSDESRGDLRTTEDGTASILTENWGFLVALLPERKRLVVDEPFAQSDIPLSILDYLGFPESGSDFFGRSVFRRYDRGRPLFYGSVNFRMIGALKPDGSIVQCRREGKQCAHYLPFDGRIFADTLPRIRDDERWADIVREMARRSLPPRNDGPVVVPLLSHPVYEVRHKHWQMVQGISQVSLETDEWYEVDVEVEAHGKGTIELRHKMSIKKQKPLIQLIARIEPGQTLRLRYTLASDIRLTTSTLRTHARMAAGEPAELIFRKRRFELMRGAGRPPQGVQLHVNELSPPSENPGALWTAVVPIEKHRGFLERRLDRGMTREQLDKVGTK